MFFDHETCSGPSLVCFSCLPRVDPFLYLVWIIALENYQCPIHFSVQVFQHTHYHLNPAPYIRRFHVGDYIKIPVRRQEQQAIQTGRSNRTEKTPTSLKLQSTLNPRGFKSFSFTATEDTEGTESNLSALTCAIGICGFNLVPSW